MLTRRDVLRSTGAAALALGLSGLPVGGRARAADGPKKRLLVYTRSQGFQHDVVKVGKEIQKRQVVPGFQNQQVVKIRDGLMEGGDKGPAAVSGKADESRFIHAVEQAGELKMPPMGKLSEKEVARLKDWVKKDSRLWPKCAINSACES